MVLLMLFLVSFLPHFVDGLKFWEPVWEFPDELRFDSLLGGNPNTSHLSPNPTGPLSEQFCNQQIIMPKWCGNNQEAHPSLPLFDSVIPAFLLGVLKKADLLIPPVFCPSSVEV